MLEEQFHFQLLKCFNQQRKLITRKTAKLDVLPGQSKVLLCLYEQGSLSAKEIGDYCIIDKSTTTTLLKKMEKMGYIEKKNDKQDKRALSIQLTTLGLDKAKQVKEICEESNQEILNVLTTNEQVEILRLLKKLNDAFEKGKIYGNEK